MSDFTKLQAEFEAANPGYGFAKLDGGEYVYQNTQDLFDNWFKNNQLRQVKLRITELESGLPLRVAYAANNEQRVIIAELEVWKEAVLDALATTCADAPIDKSPRDIIHQVIDWYVTLANSENSAQLVDAQKDAARYRWLCDSGYNYHGAMIGSGSMSIGRGPYILLEPPSLNQFSNIVLGKQAADLIIDTAMHPKEQAK